MKNYSLTTTSLYALAIAMILRFFDVDFVEEDIEQVVLSAIMVVGWIGGIIGRLRKGDLKWFGKRIKTLTPQ